jgi:uncharacterized protein YfbU (UPF0304 family)
MKKERKKRFGGLKQQQQCDCCIKKLSTHKQLHCSYANQNCLRSKVKAKKVFFLSSESSFVLAVVPCFCCSNKVAGFEDTQGFVLLYQ